MLKLGLEFALDWRRTFLTRDFSDPAKSERALEEELVRLRQKLWKARGRRSRIAGTVYLLLSGLFLLLAYITRYIVFEVVSILALLLGVVFVFTGIESYVKMDVANRAVVSSLVPIASLLSYLKAEGKAIHIPPVSEQRAGRIFLPKRDEVTLPAFEEITRESSIAVLNEGVLLPSVGNALLKLYENELGDLRNFDLEYLMAWLPRVLVDGLQMAEKVEMNWNADDINVKMINLAFSNVCQNASAKVICELTGCPVCSSIAEAFSKNTGRIVYYLKCENDSIKRETNAFYRLGPALEELRRRKKVETQAGKKVDT